MIPFLSDVKTGADPSSGKDHATRGKTGDESQDGKPDTPSFEAVVEESGGAGQKAVPIDGGGEGGAEKGSVMPFLPLNPRPSRQGEAIALSLSPTAPVSTEVSVNHAGPRQGSGVPADLAGIEQETALMPRSQPADIQAETALAAEVPDVPVFPKTPDAHDVSRVLKPDTEALVPTKGGPETADVDMSQSAPADSPTIQKAAVTDAQLSDAKPQDGHQPLQAASKPEAPEQVVTEEIRIGDSQKITESTTRNAEATRAVRPADTVPVPEGRNFTASADIAEPVEVHSPNPRGNVASDTAQESRPVVPTAATTTVGVESAASQTTAASTTGAAALNAPAQADMIEDRRDILPPPTQDRRMSEPTVASARATEAPSETSAPRENREPAAPRVGADKAVAGYTLASNATYTVTSQASGGAFTGNPAAQYSAAAVTAADTTATNVLQSAATPNAAALSAQVAAVPLPFNVLTAPAKPQAMSDIAVEVETGLIARGTDAAAETRSAPQVIARPMTAQGTDALQEIVRAAMATKGSSSIELRLDPSELGQLDIELSFVEERVSITVRAERDEALDLMRRSSDELARMLREAGVDFDTLAFSQGDAQDGKPDETFTALSTEKAGADDPSSVAANPSPGSMSTRLDIRI